ncbi:unnamed protein product [[Candida] boidinii]|uniref:Unnamed protein product n=1 Tax=Candida boidinii TaxID=5477 RepID=A0A9W6SYY3_CANBO|nr:hypothetical protein B5S30_g5352 [[Candida] boidinii]OWB86834.1 hypothetical protein B5S33_g5550 [[Candida] boidinii]GME69021.1 unnamed protein product [[Candida] boidinii]GMF82177.1 unnamed protein product [[Candida] boidinii]GMF99094.1 unnamed protein product [[Candida] boidinii]
MGTVIVDFDDVKKIIAKGDFRRLRLICQVVEYDISDSSLIVKEVGHQLSTQTDTLNIDLHNIVSDLEDELCLTSGVVVNAEVIVSRESEKEDPTLLGTALYYCNTPEALIDKNNVSIIRQMNQLEPL